MDRLTCSLLVAAIFLSACTPSAAPETARGSSGKAAAEQEAYSPSKNGAVVGHFRSGEPIRLPGPVVIEPPPGPVSPASLALRSETVEEAVAASMGEAAIGITVTVDKGFVMLAGDVATEADFQRAHYVARALPGVIEVDQTQMRVIR